VALLTSIRNRAVHSRLSGQDFTLIDEMARKVPGIRLTVFDGNDRLLSATTTAACPDGPPRLGQLFLQLLLPLKGRNVVLGNMAETYADNAHHHGVWYARAVYWVDFARSIVPIIKYAASATALKWLWNRLHGA